MTIENAKIISTMLGIEDHGTLTFNIMLDYGGSVQGFGGWGLDEWDGNKRQPTKATSAILVSLLSALEIDSWEKLPGLIVRARRDENKIVQAIGHALKDKWCVPSAIFKELGPP